MKVKCYIIMQGNTEVLSEYANISQKNFLSFQITNVIKKINRLADRIQIQNTSNGVWYCRSSDKTKNSHMVLLSSESASLPVATSILKKGIEYEFSNNSQEKLKMKIAEQIKLVNANAKMQSINSNVMELQNIMKGNVSKIINNMSDLDTVQQKSERLNSMSMQFENDSRSLQEKLKRKACMKKLIFAGVGGLFLVFFIYYFFL